jgi:hypothetical protein
MAHPLRIGLAALSIAACACSSQTPSSEAAPVTPPSHIASPPTFVNGGPCPRLGDPEFPEEAGCASSVKAEGATLTVYALTSAEEKPLSWRVRLVTAEQEIDQELDAGADYPRAVGASDIDADGDMEWWLKVLDYASHGAPWARLNLMFVQDDALVPLTLDGEAMPVNYGGITRLGEGASCSQAEITLYRAEAQDPQNTRWELSRRTFRIEGTMASYAGEERSIETFNNYVDPELRRYFRVVCAGAELIPF